MGADAIERTHRENDTLTGYEEVVTAAIEVASAVFRLQFIRREAAVAAGSCAMDYDQVDTADAVQT